MARSTSKGFDAGSMPSTLVELLRWQAHTRPDKIACAFLTDGDDNETSLTYTELDRQARAIGAWLQSQNASGERVLLLYPPGLEYIAAFFGCLYAGAVAIPAYPPRLNRPVPRIQAMVADSGARLALTTEAIFSDLDRRFEQTPDLKALNWHITESVPTLAEQNWQEPGITGDTLAFFQYTSGSTSSPKGVMLSHSNLMHNLQMIQHGFEMDFAEEVGLFWLPSYHDMGLIGGILEPIYLGGTTYLMSPASFIQRPARWLEAISKYRATITGAPNFAYDLCVDQITPEQKKELDLSSLKLAFCGAEPIRASTLARFTETFASNGLRHNVHYPCYGLAEATLLVAGGSGPAVPTTHAFKQAELEQHRVIESSPDDSDALTFVSCGSQILEERIAIVDPGTMLRVKPDQVGEIWVSGPNVAQGYWGRPDETQRTFQAHIADTGEGPFLRTGDLGFIHDGHLYVTGRLKDLIIIRGRNHYPQDIEHTVSSCHPALQSDAGAAFTVQDEDGEERLVIVHEVARRHRNPDIEEVASAVRRAVAQNHELQVYALALIKPLKIPRTSSGKIKRHACKAEFLEGTLPLEAEWRADLQQTAAQSTAKSENTLARSAAASAKSEGAAAIESWLVEQIALKTGIDARQIDVQRPFVDYGLDSVQAVTLTGELEVLLNRTLPPTLAWDYPNIETLAAFLAEGQSAPAIAAIKPNSKKDSSEAIAIIGIGCRFPGANSPAEFWQMLSAGMDAVREVPADRWDIDAFFDTDPATPGKMNTRWGGFLDRIDQFDPAFFGISPREAARMDPQQRLLLEVAWEALEDAGQPPDRLAGSLTGVFVGISSYDYSQLQYSHPDYIDAYAGTGNAHSIAANRLSYLLDLRGPSMAIDTACSSSLTAVHAACQSLRTGESNLALAGGVNLLITPELTVTFSQARMMASDGRCKTFDARADGYVRGEGCGVVVLKRLSDALNDGDNILAVVRGSAVNHDGRSNGLTAPNGPSQQAVIRMALESAGVKPAQVSYVEAHGTGTPLGDPIEIHSLRAVLEEGRSPDEGYFVGSVKTNVGHLEAAAGVAGLIKVVLSLVHESIPPHLHLEKLNPHLALNDAPLAIPTSLQPWQRSSRPRVAGISAFGFGGTNAHVVLSEAPLTEGLPVPDTYEVERPAHVLALSAKSQPALQRLAQSYVGHLQTASSSLADLCFTANTGRSHFDHRLAVVASTPESLREQLEAFASEGRSARGLYGKIAHGTAPRIAFLFTGQGAQYPGMGRSLYETQPTFRAALDRCDEILRPYLESPLLTVLYPEGEGDALLHETAYTQPALFALEYALAELWQSWGIMPDVVMGHSVGEYVAACVAGVFSLEDGLALIAERARLMQTLPQNGMMAAVFASEERVASVLVPYLDSVAIAAANGPENTVISGERAAVQEVLHRLEAQGIAAKPLQVSHAFHSPLMDPVREAFLETASCVRFSTPRIPLVSNLTGRRMEPGSIPDPAYWAQHLREAVRFADGLQAISDQDIFLELGPQPTLLGMGRQCLPGSSAAWLPSLSKGQDDWQVLLNTLGSLYVQGAGVDWDSFDRAYPRRRVSLPTYPFERERYWLEFGDAPARQPRQRASTSASAAPNGRLGRALRDFGQRLADLPETASLETILSIAADVFNHTDPEIKTEARLPAEPATLTRAGLLEQDPADRVPLVQAYIRSQVARVLGLSPDFLDMDQPFDALGLDSLMAIELKNRIETDLGVGLPIVYFLEGPTSARIADLALEYLAEPSATLTTPIVPVTSPDGSHPLSYGQQAMWFLHQLIPDGVSFNVAGAVRLLGPLDVPALGRAFQELVSRHASLRTSFHMVDGRPVQQAHEHIPAPLQVLDASAWSEQDLQSYLVREAHRPFDLDRGALLRVILLERSPEQHVLLLSINHIVTDFWSMSLLAQELFVLYTAARSSAPALLPSSDVQYTDYVHWQAANLAGPEGERLRAYWEGKLAGELPILNLPTDRPRGPHQVYEGDNAGMIFNPRLTRRVKELARAHGATLFTVLLAGFQALLHRYTNQDDLIVGSVMAGRNHPELANLVGYFINPVALRADLSGQPTFAEFLERVKQTVLEAVEHQDYPPNLLAEHLHITRDPSRPPIFETMFILQKAQVLHEQGLSAFALGLPGVQLPLNEDITLESLPLGGQPAQFDLTLMMAELGEELAASLHYNTALFDADTIQRMLAHIEALFEGITADPHLPVTSYSLLAERERHLLLEEWNATGADFEGVEGVHRLVEAQVARTPDVVAAACAGQQLTYRQLNARSNQLARYLRSLGVGSDTLVGIEVQRSLEMLVAMLGVLKAGGAYVPLDPTYPSERLAYMLEDSAVPVLLTQQQLVPSLPDHTAQVICLDTDWDLVASMDDADLDVPVSPDDRAYVIYTSGSTGRPKGVEVLHRGVTNFLSSMRRQPGIEHDDIMLAVTTLSFDIAVLELLLPLTVGARVEIATREEASDGLLLAEKLSASGATIMQATPATWRMLIDMGWQGSSDLRALCGGEALTRDLADQLLGRCHVLWNMYGPTETTVWSTLCQVTLDAPRITIGRPIANTQVYLLDPQMEPVPIGVAGELYIGGAGVARGYLNRPELTAERFVPDRFSAQPGARLYKTGDLARYLPDGSIEYLGRSDNQVKVRGFRIEPGEIEAAAARHPSIKEQVVVARQDSQGHGQLVLYFVPQEDQPEPTIDELRGFLGGKLPHYMVPSLYVALDALPLTPNGKVNRRALPSPPDSRPDLATNYVAPRTPLEETLAQLCAEVLGLEQVGVLDNFFDLGGNSLLATSLIFRVREQFDSPLPLRSLFEDPTVAGLARALEHGHQDSLFDALSVEELNSEAVLDPAITGDGLPFEPVAETEHILLTGATGFVGAFLLHDLLRMTGARIHCLVRASTVEEGGRRLQDNLASYGLWEEGWDDRIEVVLGDLAQPSLGLSSAEFDALAEQIDTIYHNGAMVNFVYPFQAHRAPNVLGTQEVLRLASRFYLKPVHFVSTLSVFHTGSHNNGTVFHEGEDLDSVGAPFGGYAQSKWVAEKLVMTAGDRGMPVAIYRPGLVSGSSTTGAWNTDDMMSTLAKLCISIGVAPDLDVMVDVVPVDYVSSAIVHLSQQAGSLGKAFHLSNPQPVHYRQLVEAVQALGFPLETVPFEQWRDALFDQAAQVGENGWNPFLPLIEEVGEHQVFMPPFDCQNTLAGLAGSAIACPPVGPDLFATYLGYFSRIGFLDGVQ